jgi:hypothetical protein
MTDPNAPTGPVSSPASTPATPTQKWLNTIAPLAARIKMSAADVTEKILFEKLVSAADDSGAETIVDADAVSDDDLIGTFPVVAKGDLKKGIKDMRATAAPAPAPVAHAAPTAPAAPRTTMLELLAPVPGGSGSSMLTGLSLVQVGKIDRDVVAAGIRDAIASRAGLFSVSKVLLEMMDDFMTNRMEEPAGSTYYDLENLIASEDNAEVLRLLKVDSRFVSKARKNEFLERIGALWEPARGFQSQLKGWYDAYLATFGNPAMIAQTMASALGGGGMVGPGMMSAPDTSALHDGAQLVIQVINKAFAGRNIPAAMALNFDAERINGFLTNTDVVRYTGCTNREELARTLASKLGTGTLVTPDYQRLEQVLVQFILSVYEIDTRAPVGTPQELHYIGALYQLGQSIPWDKLSETGSSSRRRGNGHEDPPPIGGGRRDANRPFPGTGNDR